jgi:predicted amidophosphoribosyltransferase
LHPEKLKQRGYNQSSLLAEGYASAMKIKWDDSILIRKTATSTQTKKSRYQRYENMQEVFECVQVNEIIDKNILLIDDVITTGSTLEACVETLMKSGCSGVWIATIAVA